jgi:hypothetical protein
VFTLPAEVADIAWQNKAVVYDLLFRAACGDDADHRRRSQAPRRADRHHRRIPHLGIGNDPPPACAHDRAGRRHRADGTRWISSRPAFLLPVRVLGAVPPAVPHPAAGLHDAGKLAFFGTLAGLADRKAFLRHLSPIRKKRWVVYAKPPFAGPQAVLAYLSRYTHRVAISNRRLLAFDEPASRSATRTTAATGLNASRS